MPRDYLSLADGVKSLHRAINTSTGPTEANEVIATNARGELDPSLLPPFGIPFATAELTGDLVLDFDSPTMQYLRPVESPRYVTLPEVGISQGRMFGFFNLGSYNLIIQDTTTDAILVEPGAVLWVHSDGFIWREVI